MHVQTEMGSKLRRHWITIRSFVRLVHSVRRAAKKRRWYGPKEAVEQFPNAFKNDAKRTDLRSICNDTEPVLLVEAQRTYRRPMDGYSLRRALAQPARL